MLFHSNLPLFLFFLLLFFIVFFYCFSSLFSHRTSSSFFSFASSPNGLVVLFPFPCCYSGSISYVLCLSASLSEPFTPFHFFSLFLLFSDSFFTFCLNFLSKLVLFLSLVLYNLFLSRRVLPRFEKLFPILYASDS